MSRIAMFVVAVFSFLIISLGAGFASDGEYSALPLENRAFPEEELKEWVRPVVPIVLGPRDQIFASGNIRGVALILSREEVLVSLGPFLAASSPNDVALELDMDPDNLRLGAFIIWDIDTEKGISGEIISSVPFTDAAIAGGAYPSMVRLARSPGLAFPYPEAFPYAVAKSALGEGDDVVIVGHWKTPVPELITTFVVGQVRGFRNDGLIELQASLGNHDWGAPAFVAGSDGSFMLAGIVVSANLYEQRETETLILPIEEASP